MKTLFKGGDIIATENDSFKVIRSGYLGIDGDKISYVGSAEPEEKYDSVRDFSGKILSPALINCHSHSCMTIMRGIGSDLSLHEWLYDNMFPIDDRLSGDQIKAGSELAILEMLASGTVSFSDMYMFPVGTVESVIASGMKVNMARPMLSGDEDYVDNYRARESRELFERFNGAANGRVKIEFAVHGEYTNSEKCVRAYAEDCLRYGSRMHVHLSETKSEHDACIEKYGKTPAEWFNSLGVFDSPTIAAHCVWASENDLDIFKAKGVIPVHNPTSNLKLGSGIAKVPEMLKAGIPVALGTDGAASNNNLNMFEEMHLASIIHKGSTLDPTVVPAPTALKMATQYGALAQGRADTGSIEVGKKADIIAVSKEGVHMFPCPDPISILTYSAQGSDVCMTMADGKILYENGEFLTMDKEKTVYNLKKVLSELGI